MSEYLNALRSILRVLASLFVLVSVAFMLWRQYDEAQYFVLSAIFLVLANRDK